MRFFLNSGQHINPVLSRWGSARLPELCANIRERKKLRRDCVSYNTLFYVILISWPFFLHYGSPRTAGRELGIMFFLIGQLVTIHQYGTVEPGYVQITEILNEHTPTPTARGECLMIRSPLSPSPQTQTYQSETLI